MKFNIITTSILIISLYFGTSNVMGAGRDLGLNVSKNNFDYDCNYMMCNTLHYIAQDNVDEVNKVFAKHKFLTPQTYYNNTTLELHAEKFKALKVLEFFKQRQALVVYGSYKNKNMIDEIILRSIMSKRFEEQYELMQDVD